MRTNTRVRMHLHETTRTSGGFQASASSRLRAACFINKEEIKRNLSESGTKRCQEEQSSVK